MSKSCQYISIFAGANEEAVFVDMSQLNLLNVNKVLFLNHCSWIYSAQHSTEPERAFPCLLTGQA